MKIESVRIENFRSFRDETVYLDDYSCFVGANGAGKSTVFNALNVFFRQYKDSKTDLSKLSADDFHHRETTKEIRITVTFCDLNESAVEALSNYVRQGKLIVTAVAVYDPQTERAEVRQFGNRLGLEAFKRFFEASKLGAKVAELRVIYNELQLEYPDLQSATTKGAMEETLQVYEASKPELCVLLPSEDEFYGISRGVNRLSPYIQWVFIPASKDVTEEGEESKTSALGLLLARSVRSAVNFDEKVAELRAVTRDSFQALLDAEQSALDNISHSLEERLASWAHPDIKAQVLWRQDPEKSVRIDEPWAYIKVGERGFESDLSRFGHGLQRSYMLALLQELTFFEDDAAPTLIMGIEEPELYQHPPQARYLAETLINLAANGMQVLICTHSALFMPGDNFDKVRIVRESGMPSETVVKSLAYDSLAMELERIGMQKHVSETGMVAKLYPSLNSLTNEMFFCKVLVLVEGLEDVAYLTSYLMLTGMIQQFRKYGCHIVATGGKDKIIKPLAMANMLEIPVFIMFDGDTDTPDKYDWVGRHKRENKALLLLKGYDEVDEWSPTNVILTDLTFWTSNLTSTVKGEFGEKWSKYRDMAALEYDNASELEKNPLAIGKLLELAWIDNVKSTILQDLVGRVVKFAESPFVVQEIEQKEVQ